MSDRSYPQRRGWTHRDAFVALACSAVLLCLVGPALTQVRQVSTRRQCALKVKHLSTAAANFVTVNRRFPLVSRSESPLTELAPGTLADKPEHSAGYSFITMLLPYLEERILFDRIKKASDGLVAAPFSDEVRHDGRDHYAGVIVPSLTCPEVRQSQVATQFTAMSGGKPMNVKTEYAGLAAGDRPAAGNYVALVGTHYSANEGLVENGVIVSRCSRKDDAGQCIGRGTRLRDLIDGTSKTVIICESRESAYAAWIDGQSMWVVGLDATKRIAPSDDRFKFITAEDSVLNAGPNEAKKEVAPTYSDLALDGSKAWPGKAPRRWGPSSHHAGGAIHHGFADAHVVALSAEIDPTVYARLITRDQGEPTGQIKLVPADQPPLAKIPMDLQAAIDKSIALIAKQEMETFIRTFIDPLEWNSGGRDSAAEIARAAIKDKVDQQLLRALKSIPNSEVEVRRDGKLYIFNLKQRILPTDEIRFRKTDGRWYLDL